MRRSPESAERTIDRGHRLLGRRRQGDGKATGDNRKPESRHGRIIERGGGRMFAGGFRAFAEKPRVGAPAPVRISPLEDAT